MWSLPTPWRHSHGAGPTPSEGGREGLFDRHFLAQLDHYRLVSRRLTPGALRGEHRSKRRGSGIEFADYRPYVDGDSLRFVDWPAYLRFDKLLIRRFQEETELPIAVLLDTSASMGFDEAGDGNVQTKFDLARRLAAALVYVGLSNLDRVNLVTYSTTTGSELRGLRGPNEIHRVFRHLEGLTPAGETAHDRALISFLESPRKRGLLIIISDFFDATAQSALQRFGAGFDLMAIRIASALEEEPRLAGRALLVDVETGGEALINASHDTLLDYRDLLSEQHQQFESLCRKRHWSYIKARTDQPLSDQLRQIFKTGYLVR